MFPIEVEERLLNTIKEAKDLAILYELGVNIDCFRNRKDIFKFLIEYYKKYSKIPTYDIIKVNFKDFAKYDVGKDEINYLVDELLNLDLQFKTAKVLEQSTSILKNDAKAAIDFITSKLLSFRKTTKLSKNTTDKNALERLDRYLKRKSIISSGKILGLRTGFKLFDDDYLGWQPGNLIGLVGRPGIGKTELLLYTSCVAYIENHRVLMISPELTVEEMEDRWDVLMFNLMKKGELSHKKLSSGNNINLNEYKKFLTEVGARDDWLTVDSHNYGPFTLEIIQALIDEHKPELVSIDGLPLLKDSSRNNGMWESVKNISYGLKNIAVSNKLVILITTQANRGTTVKGPEMDNISYGDALAQAADVLIMISDKEDEPLYRYIKVPKRRSGGAVINKRACITFDIDKGNVGNLISTKPKIEKQNQDVINVEKEVF